ncbi:MAG: 7TM diverse intracellular signaling domain-containing protein [Agriterribacter sp.]
MLTSTTFYLILSCFGALSLAAIYHTILYIQKRDKVLGYYCLYLWSITLYILYRMVFLNSAEPYVFRYVESLNIHLSADSNLMWVTFICYILFLGNALAPGSGNNNRMGRSYRTIICIIIVNAVWENIAANIPPEKTIVVLAVSVRVCLSAFAVWVTLRKLRKKQAYCYYIVAGTFSIIFFSLLSVLVQTAFNKSLLNINTWGWMMFGYYLDVIFFSAAMGYRLKLVYTEKEMALKKILEQQDLIRKKETASLKAAYNAREQERNRIAAELHDGLGGELSTIGLMAEMTRSSQFGLNGKYLEQISAKSKAMVQYINEIVWYLNNNNDELCGMIAHIRRFAAAYLDEAGIELSFKEPGFIPNIKITGDSRRQILLLVKETLHNIVKHSRASKVNIHISAVNDLVMRIADNGIGITCHADNTYRGNGLRNMQQRTDLLQGAMQVLQQVGTTLIFSIPLTVIYNKDDIENNAGPNECFHFLSQSI